MLYDDMVVLSCGGLVGRIAPSLSQLKLLECIKKEKWRGKQQSVLIINPNDKVCQSGHSDECIIRYRNVLLGQAPIPQEGKNWGCPPNPLVYVCS